MATASPNEAILRNALRYTISAREYAALHKYVLSRSRVLRRSAPSVDTVTRIMDGPPRKRKGGARRGHSASTSPEAASGAPGDSSGMTTTAPAIAPPADDFNARAVRHALRVFFATGASMQLYEALQRRLLGRRRSGAGKVGVDGASASASPSAGPGTATLPAAASGGGSGGGSGPRGGRGGRRSPTLRLSLSLSAILLLYRLLFRFFSRLRGHLLDPAALPFRQRNPRTSAALTSPYAPAAGASLAGLALGVAPARFRTTLALMALFRALEFAWNAAEDAGAIWGVDMVPVPSAAAAAAVNAAASVRGAMAGVSARAAEATSAATSAAAAYVARPRARPWWWGAWMLQPLALGQLMHAAVFDRDCVPQPLVDFLFGRTAPTDTYLHAASSSAVSVAAWPGPGAVLDALAAMAKAHWPPFLSPVLFPQRDALLTAATSASAASATASSAVLAVAPLTNRAHPLLSSLSCATLHPADPSCARTYLAFWLRAFPSYARFFFMLYTALQLPGVFLSSPSAKRASALNLLDAPLACLQRLLAASLRSATFVTGSLSTAWAAVCFFQAWLPRHLLATQRFFLGGVLAGSWAWLERRNRYYGRALFLYMARTSLASLWRVGMKRRWWRFAPKRGGDVLVFVASLLLAGVAYEQDARAVREPAWRKGISWVRGEGWRDWAMEEDSDEEDDVDENEDGLGGRDNDNRGPLA